LYVSQQHILSTPLFHFLARAQIIEVPLLA
jgi:hypothetical protein